MEEGKYFAGFCDWYSGKRRESGRQDSFSEWMNEFFVRLFDHGSLNRGI